jgi:hypothetical protein
MATICLIVIIAFFAYQYSVQNKRIQVLKLQYEKALKGKNKAAALNAGRAYYIALRSRYGLTRMAYGKNLRPIDEVSIMNEINTMK